MPRPSERAERTGRAAYWTLLGGSSPKCRPSDRILAASFLAKIELAIDRGGWTRNEWRNLHQLYERWSRRANGMDPRFELVGTHPGRLERNMESWVKRRKLIFDTVEHRRVARPVQLVNSSDHRIRPAERTLKARKYQQLREARTRDRESP